MNKDQDKSKKNATATKRNSQVYQLSSEKAPKKDNRKATEKKGRKQSIDSSVSKQPKERLANSPNKKISSVRNGNFDCLTKDEQQIVERLIQSNKWNLAHKRPDSPNLRDYRKFINNKNMTVNLAYWLMQFYSSVISTGGIILSISRNFFIEVVSGFCQRNFLPKGEPYSYFLMYKQYLLPYEIKNLYQVNRPHNVDIGYVTYYDVSSYKTARQNGTLPRDIFLIENFCKACEFDSNKMNTKFLREKYGQTEVQIRTQNPKALGFNTSSLITLKSTMKMSEYIDYQDKYVDLVEDLKGKSKKSKSDNRMVNFAVNIDLEDKYEVRQEFLNKLYNFKEFQFTGSLDALSYLDVQIPGCSLPQVYLKVKGCWTGGHQQNTALSAININHGPGESEWIALDREHLPRLREQCLKGTRAYNQEFKIDIFYPEGLWYEEALWFIKNNYPVKKFVQRQGDIVYLGPGTLHWVRALGNSMHTAWNVMPKTLDQFKVSKQRQLLNEQIKFPVIIPLKSLVLKMLNHQYHKSPHSKLMQEYIFNWLVKEELALGQYALSNKDYYLVSVGLQDNITSCFKCHSEIFLYYIYQNETIYCLQCALQNKILNKQIKIKYHRSNIYMLLSRSRAFRMDRKLEDIPQVTGLCRGDFIGQVSYCQVAKNKGKIKFVSGKTTPQKTKKSSKKKDDQNGKKIELEKKQGEQLKQKRQYSENGSKSKQGTLFSDVLPQQPSPPEDTVSISKKSKEKFEKSRSRQKNNSSWSNKEPQCKIKYPRKQNQNNETKANSVVNESKKNSQSIKSKTIPPQQQKNLNKVLYPKRSNSTKVLENAQQKSFALQAGNLHISKQKQYTRQKIAQNRNFVAPAINLNNQSIVMEQRIVKYPRKNAVNSSTTIEQFTKTTEIQVKYRFRRERSGTVQEL